MPSGILLLRPSKDEGPSVHFFAERRASSSQFKPLLELRPVRRFRSSKRSINEPSHEVRDAFDDRAHSSPGIRKPPPYLLTLHPPGSACFTS